jgi:class 3 adenylate cyclase
MTTLRTTAIMKTDIRDSTARFWMLPEVDLHTLHTEHTEHRQFVARLAQAHDGRVVKGEGDGYWVVYPSVTAAALAAMSMQEELRLARSGKGDDRAVVHKGILYGFTPISIFLTGQVQQTLMGTPWAERLHSVDIGLPSPRLAGIAIYKLQ